MGPLYLGIDVGAINTKMALYSRDNGMVGSLVRQTSVDTASLARSMLSELISAGVDRKEISTIVSTGQGRRAVELSDMSRTEITCFAKGAYHIDPGIGIAVDMGGHGVRVMKMGEMGIISDFRTNDKCSSGTGCFIDATARALGIEIDKVGDVSSRSCSPERVNSTCTIFAESEVVSLVAKGKKKEDILAGLNGMVSRRIGGLINSMRTEGRILVGGGVANNAGIVTELKNVLDREVVVPDRPELIGAIGAALLSPDLQEKNEGRDDATLRKRSFWDRLLGVKG